MKRYVLVGAIALFTAVLAMMPAMAAVDRITAMGTVTDELGRPVEGATITLIDENFHDLGTVTSDSNGNFKFMNVELAGSQILKVKVSYILNGTTYSNRIENTQWLDASQGLVSFDRNSTRLNNYPESNHGYVWGTIMDSASNGKVLIGTVYLENDTMTLSRYTTSMYNGYEFEAAPGDYIIYAVRPEGNTWLVSNRTKITITPSYALYESAPLTLVANVVAATQPAPKPPVIDVTPAMPTPHAPPPPTPTPQMPSPQPQGRPVKVLPLAAALALGIVLMIAGWTIWGRKQ